MTKKLLSFFLSMIFVMNIGFVPASAQSITVDEDEYNITQSVPRGMARVFSEECLIGSPSDYSTQIGDPRTYNITVTSQSEIDKISEATSKIAGAVGSFIGSVFGEVSAKCFEYAVEHSVEANAFNDADPNAMSFKITKYKDTTHSIGANEFYRYEIKYYGQSNCVASSYIVTINYYESITYLR